MVHPQRVSANQVSISFRDISMTSIWLDDNTIRILVPGNPRTPAVALILFLFSDGLDERADAAKYGVYASALILEHRNYMSIAATTSLNFATVEHGERKASIPAQT